MAIVKQTSYGVSLPCAAEAIVEGYVYKDNGSGQMTKTTAKNDVAVAVALSSSLDPQTGAPVVKAAGDPHGFALIGSGLIVKVASVASATYQFGAKVYLSTTAGMVTSSVATSTPIGHYVGKDNMTTSSAGELIDVYLDMPIGSAVES